MTTRLTSMHAAPSGWYICTTTGSHAEALTCVWRACHCADLCQRQRQRLLQLLVLLAPGIQHVITGAITPGTYGCDHTTLLLLGCTPGRI